MLTNEQVEKVLDHARGWVNCNNLIEKNEPLKKKLAEVFPSAPIGKLIEFLNSCIKDKDTLDQIHECMKSKIKDYKEELIKEKAKNRFIEKLNNENKLNKEDKPSNDDSGFTI
jgi:hypothetical protein